MTPDQDQDLGPLLLSFYECLTDPDKLDTLMEMLTSWLDDDSSEVIAPKVDYHADHAWRLLGQISEPEHQSHGQLAPIDETYFKTQADVERAIGELISVDDQHVLEAWFAAPLQSDSLLLRVFEEQATELVILSQRDRHEGFVLKRTGPKFHGVISKYVSDSFNLTHAELTLVQELLSGGTLREISDRLGKSWETTRSQVKSLTNKLGVNSQGDILRMVIQASSLMPSQPQQANAGDDRIKTLLLPDGRIISYEVDGPRSDKTLVYLHGLAEGRHWPKKARRSAVRRGWQIIRISRAGRGLSSINKKEKEALLQSHIDDVMAVVDHEAITRFSIYGAADGFAVGYSLAMQYPERVLMAVGLEVAPPILSRKAITGYSGKMKTFGLACLYAPKTIKFMFLLAMNKWQRLDDRYSTVHPLLGVELGKIEDIEGIETFEANFQDLMEHKAEGLWRDATIAGLDWAEARANTNTRPRVALIHCRDSMIYSSEYLNEFATRIGAPIYRIDSFLPHVSAPLSVILETLENSKTKP